MDIGIKDLFEMYRKMYLIRIFEKKAIDLYKEGINRGALHSYIGEEAVAVGACSALKSNDYITSTHRGHGHCLAMGGNPSKMLAELLGKRTGYCKGKGGSMHIADPNLGILGANGIVGAGIPIAVGAGLALANLGKKNVVVCFFGDGATCTGAFHEALNMASIWKLPVVFICENNLYAISGCTADCIPVKDIATRALSYNMPGKIVDGMDVLSVYEETLSAREKAINGKGPTLIECKTYRFEGHWIADPQVYRSKSEVEEWKKKDPIEKLENKLIKENLAKLEDLKEIKNDIEREIIIAEKFAKESPEPRLGEVLDDIFI
jgi:pyruvate dehydrogenase E1 component alpha subunit